VLGLGACRRTRYVHFVHCAQTAAASQKWRRAARAGPEASAPRRRRVAAPASPHAPSQRRSLSSGRRAPVRWRGRRYPAGANLRRREAQGCGRRARSARIHI